MSSRPFKPGATDLRPKSFDYGEDYTLDPGDLDRRITLQRKTETKNTLGQPTEAWSTYATVWAQKMEKSVRSVFTSDQMQANRNVIFRIRYRAGISDTDAVFFEGQRFQIRGISEYGRRVGLDLECEVYGARNTV
ncbi:MAG: phage head closure protein [Pseudomonadota bacterium]